MPGVKPGVPWLLLLLLVPRSVCYCDTFSSVKRLPRRSPPNLASAAATTRGSSAAAVANRGNGVVGVGAAVVGAAAASRHAWPLLAAAAAGGGDKPGSRLGEWIVKYRSVLLLVCLVVHKCSTDMLTSWTIKQGAYSGKTVAVMSEVVKFPLIATAIASFGGGSRAVLPTFRAALTSAPFANAWISLCYTFNNLLYFGALGALSPVAYQVLSQSKTLFTAGLMYFIVGKKLLYRQMVAIGMLIGGALLVQYEELAKAPFLSSLGLALPIIPWPRPSYHPLASPFLSSLAGSRSSPR